MPEERYNGWANRATWNVALWVDNTESSYRFTQEYTRNLRHRATAEDAKNWYSAFFPSGRTPDGDKLSDITNEGWEELADALREEQQEHDPELYAEMEEG